MFTLHPTLAADTIKIGDLSLCSVLLLNDQRYPWIVLVPKRTDIREIFELSDSDQSLFWSETNTVAKKLNAHYKADKMNVAALGNKVPQLHMHIIVRYINDAAWPAPVWGHGIAQPYTAEQSSHLKEVLVKLLLATYQS